VRRCAAPARCMPSKRPSAANRRRSGYACGRSKPGLCSVHWRPGCEKHSTLSRKSDTTAANLYALNCWQALTRYCDDGVSEVDNSAAERSLHGVALGRKNYLFAGADSGGGGERAAANYSLIGTAKLNGIDSEAHLRHVLGRIADHPINRIDDLLPWTWRAKCLLSLQLHNCNYADNHRAQATLTFKLLVTRLIHSAPYAHLRILK
jgi:hypothetical protein